MLFSIYDFTAPCVGKKTWEGIYLLKVEDEFPKCLAYNLHIRDDMSQWSKCHPQNCTSRENNLPKLLGNSLFPQHHMSEFTAVQNYTMRQLEHPQEILTFLPDFFVTLGCWGCWRTGRSLQATLGQVRSPHLGGSMHGRAAVGHQVLRNLQHSVLRSGWQDSL